MVRDSGKAARCRLSEEDSGTGQSGGRHPLAFPSLTPERVAIRPGFYHRSHMKRILMVIGALGVVILAGLAGGSILERSRKVAEMQALRAALDQARFSADSCKVALSWEEEGFRAFDRRVDSLRAEMEGYEDPARGGVPQDDYAAYLESFDLYNDSVGAWQARADSLRAKEAACRALVESHNYLGDSIRRRQEEMRTGTR